MSTFVNTDPTAFKGVWVFCEQREGKLMPTDFELISEGRKLADDLGVELCGLLLGDKVEGLAKELGGYGADRIIVCEHPLLKDYTTDAYTKVICDVVMEKKPEIMLIGATNIGRDLGPRCAATLHTGLTADCTHLDVDVEKYKAFLKTTSTMDVDNMKFDEGTHLKMTRPAFGGHLMATIICPRFRPQMSTVRPGVMQMQAFDQAGADKVVIENVAPALTADDIHVQVLDIKKSAEKLVDLIGADVVVAVGRGISADPEKGIKLAEELAEALGGVVGASRAVTDEGWLPADRCAALEKALEPFTCAIETREPTEDEYPQVPVQLKNNKLTRPLNMVTEMYSLPAYGTLDPNPLMAPFFILFYGIMMADMGYGLLMMIASVIISKKYRPKGTSGELFSLLGLCGISTFIMGALTGGFFGDFLTQLVAIVSPGTVFALPKLFDPLDDLTMILIGSMALGMVQIVTGMAISLIEKCKRKKFLDAFFEEITWWIVFIGIALLALGKGAAVLYVGCALVLLGPIVQGKGWGKLTGVFGSLYNHVTGYFGDILSYTRLMALMLAGSVIAQVFNMLAAMPGNVIAFIIISMLGNAMNFGLNLLGCYVHDLRLQCLEFFNKFYVDGGKPFRPMTLDTEYVDLQ